MLRKATLILLAVIQPSTTAVVVAIAVKSQRLHHYLLPLIIKSFTKVFRLSSISDFLSLKALALVINSDSCINCCYISKFFSRSPVICSHKYPSRCAHSYLCIHYNQKVKKCAKCISLYGFM